MSSSVPVPRVEFLHPSRWLLAPYQESHQRSHLFELLFGEISGQPAHDLEKLEH